MWTQGVEAERFYCDVPRGFAELPGRPHPNQGSMLMIDRHDLERLIHQTPRDTPLLSLFLDTSVNSDNKRTFQVFLAKKQSEMEDEVDSRLRAAVADAFARVSNWLDNSFEEENRGVVLYVGLDDERFEALQFPVPLVNQVYLSDRPVVAPLAQVLEQYHHHGVILIDREHVRILSVYLGTLLDEIEMRKEPIPTPSDVQAGGYSHKRYQKRKAEEMRMFFKDFAREVESFVQAYRPQDLVLLGTTENVAKFREFLPEQVASLISYTGHAWVDQDAGELLLKLAPHLRECEEIERKNTLMEVRDRVAQDYLAVQGVADTLDAIQEGKVDTLVLERDAHVEGSRCSHCSFVFGWEVEKCPYCGTEVIEQVDAQEEMVRMAADQEVRIIFAEPEDRVRGAEATLRF